MRLLQTESDSLQSKVDEMGTYLSSGSGGRRICCLQCRSQTKLNGREKLSDRIGLSKIIAVETRLEDFSEERNR
jgi:hypothetical protein